MPEQNAWPEHLRPVKGIRGWLSAQEAALLYREALAVDEGCIVEVGSFRGRSTTALGLGVRAGHGVPVYAIDPHEPFSGPLGGDFGPEDRGAFFRNMLRTKLYRHVRLVNLPSTVVAPGWDQPVGMLWLDGDHNYEAVRADFLAWQPHLLPGAAVIFDDATKPDLGPARVVPEAIAEHGLVEQERVGKVVLLRNPG